MSRLTDLEKKRLRVALDVLAYGTTNNVRNEDLEDLGWDSYKFGYYGKPDFREIKKRCSEIIFDCITKEDPEPEVEDGQGTTEATDFNQQENP